LYLSPPFKAAGIRGGCNPLILLLLTSQDLCFFVERQIIEWMRPSKPGRWTLP
jgi:hypothetical protein